MTISTSQYNVSFSHKCIELIYTVKSTVAKQRAMSSPNFHLSPRKGVTIQFSTSGENMYKHRHKYKHSALKKSVASESGCLGLNLHYSLTF